MPVPPDIAERVERRLGDAEFNARLATIDMDEADPILRAELAGFVRAEFVRLYAVERAAWEAKGEDAGKPPAVRTVTTALVGNVLQALRGLCRLPAAVDAHRVAKQVLTAEAKKA